jgi:hypothetical protein
MIYNHRNNNTLWVLANQMPSPRIGRSSSSSVASDDKSSLILDYTLTARYDIKKGDELFTDYGGEKWFDKNSITYVEEKMKATTCSITQASDGDDDASISDGNEGCHENKSDTDNTNTIVATNTAVNADGDNSLIALHGCPMSLTQVVDGKVYAVQYIAQNSIIEISRALLVPDHIGDDNDLERYLWYSSHNPLSHAILLLGQGALYSTPAESHNNLEIANLYYSWYFFDDDNDSSDSSSNRKCEQKMFIYFRARRNIEPNEELTVPLELKNGSDRRYLLEHWLLEGLKEWCL